MNANPDDSSLSLISVGGTPDKGMLDWIDRQTLLYNEELYDQQNTQLDHMRYMYPDL